MYAYKDRAGSFCESAWGECIRTVKLEESVFFLYLLPFVQQYYHPEEEEVWKSMVVLMLPMSIIISGVKRA